MKIFFLEWLGRQYGLIGVAEEMIKIGHQIVIWSGFGIDKEVDRKKFSGTWFYDSEEILRAYPSPGVDFNDFPPPSPDLLEKLYECESECLIMMNKRYDWMCVYERKRMYYSWVRFWHGILLKYAPDIIIISAPPHAPFEFIIYYLAKILGIHMIMFDNTWVTDRLSIMDDYRVGSKLLAEELEKNKNKQVSINDLPLDLRNYYLQQTNPKVDSTPPSVNNFKKNYTWKNLYHPRVKFLIDNIKNGNIFSLVGRYIYKQFIPNIKDEFLSVQSSVDMTQPFIYVPLHYQPECTTSPLGGIFVDQLLMVETLSEALPEGWNLYVKENPQQWQPRGLNYFGYRYKGFYKALAAIPKVRLVSLDTSTYDLIHASQAVATVTGTAGWEAALRNKPVLIFGYPWYRHCYGIQQVNDVDSVKKAIERICKGFRPNPENTLRYLDSFNTVSPRGFFDAYGRNFSPLSTDENKNNILKSILNEIDNINLKNLNYVTRIFKR